MSWLQIRLAITPDQAEALEDQLLQLGAVSVTFMDAEDQPIFEPDLNTTPLWSHTHLLALFEADTDPDALLAHLQLLRGGDLPEHQTEVIEDQDWERSWMDNFQPMRFGRRLWIVPSWHAAPEPDSVNLLLDPGLAFGTGTHPTTALCLEWLDAQTLDDRSLLDFGCGSGILAIAGLLLCSPGRGHRYRSAGAGGFARQCRAQWHRPGALHPLPARTAAAGTGRRGGCQHPCRAARLTGAADHRSGQAGRQAGAVRHPRRTGRRGSRGLQRRLRLDPTADKDGWVRISGVRRS